MGRTKRISPPKPAHTNGIESVWAVLKRGFYELYNSFRERHLQRSLDEFTYRLNEDNVKRHYSMLMKQTRPAKNKTSKQSLTAYRCGVYRRRDSVVGPKHLTA